MPPPDENSIVFLLQGSSTYLGANTCNVDSVVLIFAFGVQNDAWHRYLFQNFNYHGTIGFCCPLQIFPITIFFDVQPTTRIARIAVSFEKLETCQILGFAGTPFTLFIG